MQAWFQTGCAWRRLVLFVSGALALLGGLAARGATPHWMSGTSEDGKSRRLSKTFATHELVQRAELKLAADFCAATVTLNGQPVIAVEPYCPLQVVDVTRHLKRGRNELAVSTMPLAGPAAVAVSLTFESKDREATTIISDAA